MEEANQILLNHKPLSFGTDLKVIAETENVRNFVADSLKVKSHEVFFGYGSLNSEIEIINQSILSLGVENIFTSKFENSQKLKYLEKLNETGKINLIFIETSPPGEIDFLKFENILSKTQSKSLISLSHANLCSGQLLPLKNISAICSKNAAYFHLNLNLTIGRYSIDLQGIKPDFVNFDCSLINGPVGIGILILNDKINIDNPTYHALVNYFNTCENKNLSLIYGFYKAFSIALEHLDENRLKIIDLKNYFVKNSNSFSGIITLDSENKKKGIINLIPLFIDKNIFGDYLIEKLDLQGIQVRQLNYPIDLEEYNNHNFISIALNEDITESDIDYLFESLLKLKK
jgi:cysteine desulfurase